ncbi:MAG: thioesterase family protein [Alphaproteobacteria bacterium]|nr:thioesterase [Rhodospirillaceae bacterium]MBT6511372.1 thioesterase [Rhodospirillaceae bacterium]MDG2482354.1 thioesterase family protein [Alphaproteobacteria bacterium]
MSLENIYSVEVPDAWTDHYGHMNEGYYVVAASDASWALQAKLGIGTDYYDATGFALVTVEAHVRYLDEVNRGETLSFNSLILGYDSKRLHTAHVFKVGERECGTIEFMWLHLDHKAGRTAPFPEEIEARLAQHLVTELPDWASRQIGLKKK